MWRWQDKSWWRGAWVVAALLLGAGCARPLYRNVTTVTALDENRFWAVGSEQLALYYDGERFFRHDYPRGEDAPDWAYETGYGSPPAKVVVYGGEPWLFTRLGEAYRWGREGWASLGLHLTPASSYDHVQVDQVARAPAGGLVIQLHAETLLFGTLEELRAGGGQRETTPTYFTWLDYLGDHLYGLGWDEGGEVRALYRRASGGWALTSRLGRFESGSSSPSVFALQGGTPVVVASYGLVATGPVEPVAASGLTTIAARESAAPIALPTSGTWIAHAYAGPPGRALLLLGSAELRSGATVLELRGERWLGWLCPSNLASEAVGAYPRPEGWRVVVERPAPWDEPQQDPLQRVGVVDLPSEDCRQREPLQIAE